MNPAKKFVNAPRLVPSGPPRITTWGQALRQCRERAGYAVREVAQHCSAGVGDVEKWEAGVDFPRTYQLKGIYTLKGMRVLTTFQHLLPSRTREAIAEEEKAASGQPPAPVTEPPAVESSVALAVPARPPMVEAGSVTVIPPPPRFRAFRDGLRYFREEVEKIGQRELGDLVGVHASTISTWELGITLPTQENYAKLLELIPALRDAPKPRGLKDGAPRGMRPGAHKAGTLSPIEEVGAAYARALATLGAARAAHAAVKHVADAEAAIKVAEEAATEAQNKLLAATARA